MHDPADIKIRPERLDAIHRAMLAGLLGNVGQKGELHEYSGPRGTKFSIFPGSGLFKVKPPWVMAGEIVETTKLYARTVARIRPEWIERVGAHLLKSQYSEPVWKSSSGHVLSFERVTLYGLVIVPRRAVHYGPIEPGVSREVFIRHALVEQDFKAGTAFFVHNRKLVEHVKYLEAKARRNDLLASGETRYRWFDARVPAGIYNWALFDKWRMKAELKEPRLLFMSEADAVTDEVGKIDWKDYPDSVRLGETKLELEYRFEPGHEADGVTVRIPLAAVNQVPAWPFEWIVPGYLREKIEGLIRSLPKTLRTSFVPVPEFAQRAFEAIKPMGGPEYALPPVMLLDALGAQLGKMSGVTVARGDFQAETLAKYLQVNFRVVDETGRTVAMGRDLEVIRRQLGARARLTFSSLPKTEYHRDNVTRWDFGDLPQRIELSVHGVTVNAYPALVDEEGKVNMWLMDAEQPAREAHRAGVRRLFMNQLREEVKHVTSMSPRMEKMCLNYSTLGSCDRLRRDLGIASADRAMFNDADDVRTQEQFIERSEHGWRRLVAAAKEVTAIAEEALEIYQGLQRQLANDYPPLLLESIEDIRDHLTELMPGDFLVVTPFPWLGHLPRYLKGIAMRLSKLMSAGQVRDAGNLVEIRPLVRKYEARRFKHAEQEIRDAELVTYRWMLEEYRVSLFAQELRTAVPVSRKRLDAQWEKVRE